MKYNEQHKLLREIGCYPMKGKQIAGHLAWFSPVTGRVFPTSHHGSEEVNVVRSKIYSVIQVSNSKK